MAITKTFAVNLDMKREVANDPITVVEGDSGNVFVVTLTDDGAPVNLSGCRVLAVFSLPTKRTVEQDSEGNGILIGGADNNVLTIEVCNTSFAVGTTNCEIQVYSGPEYRTLVTSAKFNFRCRPTIVSGEMVQAAPAYPILQQMIIDATAAITATNEATAAALAALLQLSAFWTGTQAEFEAVTPSVGTLYFVLQEEGV